MPRPHIVCGGLIALLAACSSGAPASDTAVVFPDEALTTISSESGAMRVALRTAPSQPPERGTCTVELTLTDANGVPQDGLGLEVVPFMSAHGHGTAVKPAIEPNGDGKYLVRNVDLFMPGDWDLRLTLSGARTDHATPKITVR